MANMYDAIVVGAGPNGLAAAITMQQAGCRVLLLEAKDTVGGGARTAELTLPGFHHDVCSAIHPLAAASPFFTTLPLQKFGLQFIYPPLSAAHPFDDGSAAVLTNSVKETASYFGVDAKAYVDFIQPIVDSWPKIAPAILGPLQIPLHPLSMAKFGIKAIPSIKYTAKEFTDSRLRGLLAGMAAHAIQPLDNLATSAFALVLMATGHIQGWPIAKGGSQSIADALAAYFRSIGGDIETSSLVTNVDDLPPAKAVLFDVTPKQLMAIAGEKFSKLYRWQLGRYKYGMGVCKVDWALHSPIPFKAQECLQAGTVHLGNSFEEIFEYEKNASAGSVGESPFVLLAQQSLFDASRAPEGFHTAWAYCHVPNGSSTDMTAAIEQQVERFAPGFKDTIISRNSFTASQMEAYNNNYIGGDINGGVIDITQLFTRPVLRLSPYRTSATGLYLCSSSTPPGGGVHGMCGYHAAKRALQDVFHITENSILS